MKPTTPEVIVSEIDRLTQPSVPPTIEESLVRRVSLNKAHQRFVTAAPNEAAPDLVCPMCMTPLVYEKTFFGGVSRRHPERWDYFNCMRCGEFSYRHRTRKLRHLA
jgi:hypothetical protein